MRVRIYKSEWFEVKVDKGVAQELGGSVIILLMFPMLPLWQFIVLLNFLFKRFDSILVDLRGPNHILFALI